MFAKKHDMSEFGAFTNFKSFPNKNTDREPRNVSNFVQTIEGIMVNLHD